MPFGLWTQLRVTLYDNSALITFRYRGIVLLLTVALLLDKRFSRMSRAPLGPAVDPMTWIFLIRRAKSIVRTTVHVDPPLQAMTPDSTQLALSDPI